MTVFFLRHAYFEGVSVESGAISINNRNKRMKFSFVYFT